MSAQYASYPGPVHNGGIPGQGIYPSSLPNAQNAYNINQANNVSSFAFRKRVERVDWRKIAAIDVDSITRNLEFNTLQDNIMNITFCNIETEVDIRMIDPNFLKLFKLAQLTIEYLLHSQDYLTGNMSVFDQKVRKVLEEHEATKKLLERSKLELAEVKKESHKRKKMLIAQQQIIQAGSNAYNKCPYCDKAFVNPTFLQSHLARRHTELVNGGYYTGETPVKAAAPLLVQSQAPPMERAAPSHPKPAVSESLQKDLQEIKERLQTTESQLVEEKNTRSALLQKEKNEQAKREILLNKDMDKWKQDQLGVHHQEMDNMRDLFMRELKEMGEKYRLAEDSLHDIQRRKQSNLGNLMDESHEDRELLRQQREEVAMMKEQLQHQVANVEDAMQQKFTDQEKRWKERIRENEEDHQREIERLDYALEIKDNELDKEREHRGNLKIQLKHKTDEVVVLAKKTKAAPKKAESPRTKADSPRTKVELVTIPQEQEPRPPKEVVKETIIKRTKIGLQMEPDSEDEDDETARNTLTNSMKTATGTFTGTSTGGTGTFGSFHYGTGSLSLSGTRSIRLIDEVKNNPNVLKMMKDELRGNLENELARRGISKDAQGISSPVLNDKMSLLKSERQQIAKKHKNFYDIRQQFLNELEILSKDELKRQTKTAPPRYEPAQGGSAIVRSNSAPYGLAKTPPERRRDPVATPAKASRPAQPRGPLPSAPPRESPKPSPAPSQPRGQSPIPRPITPQGGAPRPVPRPRSTSPTGKGMMSTVSTGTFSSTGKSVSFTGPTVTSSKWDSSDEDDDEDYTDGPIKKQLDDDDDSGDEDDDWDDVTEMDDIIADPMTVGRKPAPAPYRSTAAPTPTGKGTNVLHLTRSLEEQLSVRSVKKPAGSVDTVKPRKKEAYDEDEEDDSFPSVSSEEESALNRKPKPSIRGRPNTASRASSDVDQSNTYNGMWDSGSRGGSAAANGGKQSASSKNTLSSSDWDSDVDLSVDDLK